MCVGFWAGVTCLRYTVLTSPKKGETAVHCCDPILSVLVMLVSRNVFHVVSALQSIACLHKEKKIERRNLTCDQPFFLNSRGKEKMRTPYTITSESSARSPESGAKAGASFINHHLSKVSKTCAVDAVARSHQEYVCCNLYSRSFD